MTSPLSVSSTRQSTGRFRRSDDNERDIQEGNDDNICRVNRHQGHHSREHREQFYRTFHKSTNIAHNSPRPIVQETAPSISPAILRPVILTHSVTGLRIPRVGSIPTTTPEMRISTGSQTHASRYTSHEIRSSGSVFLGQPTQATTFVDMTPPIEPITAIRTRPTATITRAEMEGRADTLTNLQGLVRDQEQNDNTSDEDTVNLGSSHESNDEQVTEEYSDDVSTVDQVREENEDIWFIGEYDIERSPILQISSPDLPHRPMDIRDILENHPDTKQPTVSLREIGNESISRSRTVVSGHVEPIKSSDSNVIASTSDNKRKRKSADVLHTSTSKCSKSEFTPPPMRPLPTRVNDTTTALLSNGPYSMVSASPRSGIPNRWEWHRCQEFNCGLMSNNMNYRPECYLNHIECPYRPTGWFQAPYHDDRNLIIRNSIFTQVWKDNPYFRYQIRDINQRIRELLEDYSPF